MPLHQVTFEDPAKTLVVTDTGLVAHHTGFPSNAHGLRGFTFIAGWASDVSVEYAIKRGADVTGMHADLHLLSEGIHPVGPVVTSFRQVTRYHRHGDERYIPDADVAELLSDPAFYADGAVYREVAATHGIDEDDWEFLTLGHPQAITWKEGRGFTASVHGEELVAASKTV